MKLKKGLQIFGIWCLSLMILLTGCEMKQVGNMAKTEVEFTVVEPDEVPSELAVIIEENKQGEIKLTYEDQGYMYLVRGYGQQKTGGYSIAVNEVFLAEDGLHVDTSLIGPPRDQEIRDEASYPYLVIKIEAREAEVLFD
mgnify:FL=1